MNQNHSIRRTDNTITIYNLGHPRDVSAFIRAIREIRSKGYEDISIDLTKINSVFPNACVPIAATIQYYRDEEKVEIDVIERGGMVRTAHFDHPIEATSANIQSEPDILSRVWQFHNPQTVNNLVTAIVHSISERIECAQGVLNAFEWSLNEVIDNVLQHSQASRGFVMAQVHHDSQHLAICVADTGIGIQQSFLHSKHKPRDDVDAITLALKEGVTRDPSVGQGNGLWGLYQIIQENSGVIGITSGSGLLRKRSVNEDPTTRNRIPYISGDHKGTIVDFQINASRTLNVSKALRGHEPINLRLEDLETDSGNHLLMVRDHAHGTGTRKAATQIRNRVINLINEGARRVILDFSNITVISSSFADEFIGKLVTHYGFYNFHRIISIQGLDESMHGVLHRSVAQRMMSSIQPSEDS